MHFARAALRHHHELAARQVLDRGAAASCSLDQLHRGTSESMSKIAAIRPVPVRKVIDTAVAAEVPVPCGWESITPSFAGLIARFQRG